MARSYRPEVDGLRGVAVLPVILYHAGFSSFQGGFVGVDVFFVISGYLITSIILTELEAGTFTIPGFYERRARRILPAMSTVIIACVPVAWVLLPPEDLLDFARSTLSVALFSSNVYFKNHGDYFTAASELRPLLHTWSLGVEEQFYLLFPLVLVVGWRRGKALLVPALVIALLGSLTLAHWAAIYRPGGAFFLLPTRAWELLVGALTAVCISRREHAGEARELGLGYASTAVASTMSALGLFLILSAILTYDADTLMPGLPALVPTLGTAGIILFASPKNLVGRLLGSRSLVGVGLISYSAYLWHQPLLAFVRWGTVLPPSDSVLLFFASMSLPLAYITWRFIESPFRDRSRFDRGRIAWFAAGSSAVLIAIGGGGVLMRGAPSRFELAAETAGSFQLQAIPTECSDGEKMSTRPDWLCRVGSASAAVSFLLVGDSHAIALMPAFDSAGRILGLSGEFTAMSACPPIVDVFKAARPLVASECHDWSQRVVDHARAVHVPLVILVARWSAYTDGGYWGRELRPILLNRGSPPSQASSRLAVVHGVRRTVDALVATGARVVIVSQIPEQQVDVPYKIYSRVRRKSLAERTTAIRSYSVLRSQHEELQSFVTSALRGFHDPQRVEIASFEDALCDDERCLIGSAEKSWYVDDHHLSQTGAYHVAQDVVSLLKRVRAWPSTIGLGESP